MNKKVIAGLLSIVLFLVGCKSMDSSNSVTTQEPIESKNYDIVDDVSNNTISTKEQNNGIVEYTVKEIQIGANWSEVGVSEETVTESGTRIDSNSSIILLTIDVKNIDVEKENGESNINCLSLADNEEISNPNPDGPVPVIGLSYFDKAPAGSLESGRTDYAHYQLPEIGETEEIKIGFVVPTAIIEKNGLSLVHTYMGLEDATILPLVLP